MKRFCLLFTLLIGMMSFAGLRAETPDLKENSTDKMELTSIDVDHKIVLTVSNIMDDFSKEKSKTVISPRIYLKKSKVDLNMKNNALPGNNTTSHYQYKQFRKARDAISCFSF